MEIWVIILIHQLIFQGMFVAKNILLSRKIKKKIRGNNVEANRSIAFFALFISVALLGSYFNLPYGEVTLFNHQLSLIIGLLFIVVNLLISAASLIDLRDSWRVGIVNEQKTDLISTGIYKHTRNPYFLSYVLMFAAYTILLQNIILFVLSIGGFLFIHSMIKKEEVYLLGLHGDSYLAYKEKVPRYLFV